ncbi:sulfurtransferase TusA family protein [Sporosarcina aquimarina]|uniref:sulfurtransferase TusA family protein n=1 Tax=Sporosarcina aquimarina TaxID=114975 RepID=UPI0020423E31|nr:sulfurtransferase TusA family protein [Sporosarcina aquimarina]
MIKTEHILDVKGLACPMPIVRTRKAMNDLLAGDVLEVLATDKGSTADIKAWAASSGHAYLGTETEQDVLHHFLKKDSANVIVKQEIPVVQLDTFMKKLEQESSLEIIDVREVEEYNEAHIPGAIHIALGEIETRMNELNKSKDLYLICQTGRRSGIAGIQLRENGFKKLYNVVPGMTEWTKQTKKGN